MTDDSTDPPHMPREQIHALALEIAAELGGTAQLVDELHPPPVRPAGPQEWRLPNELDGHRLDKFTASGRSWSRDQLGNTSRRLDAMLTGHSPTSAENAVVVELKL